MLHFSQIFHRNQPKRESFIDVCHCLAFFSTRNGTKTVTFIPTAEHLCGKIVSMNFPKISHFSDKFLRTNFSWLRYVGIYKPDDEILHFATFGESSKALDLPQQKTTPPAYHGVFCCPICSAVIEPSSVPKTKC